MIANCVVRVLAVDFTVEQIGVLSCGVIPPDRHLPDVIHRRIEPSRELADRTVVVKTGHRCKSAGVKVRGVVHCDHGVGVGRVTDDEYLHVPLGRAAQRLALRLENATICREQVGALHARLARHRTNKNRDVGVAECHVRIVGAGDRIEQREGAVVELHLDTFERTEGRRDLKQLQRNGSIRAEHGARCNTEEEAVADLACSSGNGNTNWSGHDAEATPQASPGQAVGQARPSTCLITSA